MKQKIFQGLKVIEYGSLVSAPYCTKMLADLGADVIKIEKPGTGDEARSHGPFPGDAPHFERSGLFLSLNTNKSGITLNLKTATGRGVFMRLIEEADVLVENNPPKTMKKLGIDFDALQGRNPQLIMASITPFGQSGPYKDYKAYHINCAGAGGISIGIGHPEREPLAPPLSMGEYQAGVSAATSVLIALLARRKTGKGQHIDISEVDVWAGLHVGTYVLTFMYIGVTGIRRGTHGGYFIYPNEILPCKDGHVLINCAQLSQWLRFLELMGNPEWSKDPRYRDRRAMHEKYPDEVNALLIPWLKEHTREELFELCMKNRIPLAPIYTVGDLVNQPHLKERGFFVEVDHVQAGKLKYPKGPCNFTKGNWSFDRPAPLLGEHNEEIMCHRLGYSKKDLVGLRRTGVI